MKTQSEGKNTLNSKADHLVVGSSETTRDMERELELLQIHGHPSSSNSSTLGVKTKGTSIFIARDTVLMYQCAHAPPAGATLSEIRA